MFPVFVNCRDRVTCLSSLVTWLEKSGCEQIFLLDNDSTYPPLLDYYRQTPHEVIYLKQNIGHTSIWECGILDKFPSGFYVYTDPDVIPTEDCPLNALQVLGDILARTPTLSKIGLGLKIDDLPDHYQFKENVIRWESQFWQQRGPIPGTFNSLVDTTFALNRVRKYAVSGVRTDAPYLARHSDWYLDSNNLTDEDKYYREHSIPGISHWNTKILEEYLR